MFGTRQARPSVYLFAFLHMKKSLIALFAFLALEPSLDAKLNVVATLPDFGSLARSIGGDSAPLRERRLNGSLVASRVGR